MKWLACININNYMLFKLNMSVCAGLTRNRLMPNPFRLSAQRKSRPFLKTGFWWGEAPSRPKKRNREKNSARRTLGESGKERESGRETGGWGYFFFSKWRICYLHRHGWDIMDGCIFFTNSQLCKLYFRPTANSRPNRTRLVMTRSGRRIKGRGPRVRNCCLVLK